MYEKNLSEDLRLRLSKRDMDFLRDLSSERGVSISETIRSIIGEYRRTLDSINTMKSAIELIRSEKGGKLSNGDTETDCNDLV